jgi:hypothetical protein
MKSKVLEKKVVIALRKKGYTYKEILGEVSVAKSSVSLWLRDCTLTDSERKALKHRKMSNISLGRIRAAGTRHEGKVIRDRELFLVCREFFERHAGDAFFQVGISLYWAEGAKRSSSFSFINSDVEMTNFMIKWIRAFLITSESEMRMRVFTHKAFEHEKHELLWSKWTGIPIERFGKTIFKTQGLAVKKRPNYSGCARIELGKVKYLLVMKYWQQMLVEYHKKREYSANTLL